MIELTARKKILLISIAISAVLLSVTAFLTQDVGAIINVGVIAIFIIVTPSFIHSYAKFVWLKSVESEFPNFIRDLANLKRSGLTLPEAVKLTTKTNYGKLTPEVKKFANKLSWNVPFLRALELFGENFKSSTFIMEAINIIKESYKSGGDIASILDSLARDMVMLKDAEEERRNIVRQHVMIMYGIFIIFIGISIGIISLLVPLISSSSEIATTAQATSFSYGLSFSIKNPCADYPGLILPCGLFSAVCSGFGISSGINCYYISLFFFALIIEAISIGLITGQISENSAFAGIKHSLIMLALTFVIFTLIIKLNLIAL